MLIYAVSLDLFIEWWLGIVLFVLVVAYGVVAAKRAKNNNGGFISFKEAFIHYFITVALGAAISSVVGIVIFNFIDPEASTHLNEQILLKTKKMMEENFQMEDGQDDNNDDYDEKQNIDDNLHAVQKQCPEND